jgi:hypothetical protein
VQEFIPTTLGVALIEGYESMGFEISLAKPFLRKEVRYQSTSIIIRTQSARCTADQYMTDGAQNESYM